mmetsp:Transcript_24809/g.84905  ORF Transcript_24809/g.84905 Transcript_24809/m.84905 type:complete len:208 (-) Transcript_24809:146-769(-)
MRPRYPWYMSMPPTLLERGSSHVKETCVLFREVTVTNCGASGGDGSLFSTATSDQLPGPLSFTARTFTLTSLLASRGCSTMNVPPNEDVSCDITSEEPFWRSYLVMGLPLSSGATHSTMMLVVGFSPGRLAPRNGAAGAAGTAVIACSSAGSLQSLQPFSLYAATEILKRSPASRPYTVVLVPPPTMKLIVALPPHGVEGPASQRSL